jgi:hypothetical protein
MEMVSFKPQSLCYKEGATIRMVVLEKKEICPPCRGRKLSSTPQPSYYSFIHSFIHSFVHSGPQPLPKPVFTEYDIVLPL